MKIHPYSFIRYFLSSILLISGFAKAFNIEAFATEVALFTEAYLFYNFILYRYSIAIILCAIEIIIGFKLFCKTDSIAIWSSLLMFTFFFLLTGLNYFFPPTEGSIESCGCFGELVHLSPALSFYKNIAFLFMSLYLVINRHSKPYNLFLDLKNTLLNKYTYLLIVLSLGLPMYSYIFLNKLSQNHYIIGFWLLLIAIITILFYLYRKNAPFQPYK